MTPRLRVVSPFDEEKKNTLPPARHGFLHVAVGRAKVAVGRAKATSNSNRAKKILAKEK